MAASFTTSTMFATDTKQNLGENGGETGRSDLQSSYPAQFQHGNQINYRQTYSQVTHNLPYEQNQVIVFPTEGGYTPRTVSKAAAYCLIPLLGLLGIHHFYLHNQMLAAFYCCTFGLYGMGWIVDCFRIPCLVERCNEELKEAHEKGYWLMCKQRFVGRLQKISLVDAYLLWLPPLGLYGIPHFYLGRPRYALLQGVTLGANVLGWVVDLFRMPWLVRKANEDITKMKAGITVERPPFSVLDAYLLGILFGFLGLHHFYLGNIRRGILYVCTLGVFGLGWLLDIFLMPWLVKKANIKMREAITRGQQQADERLFVVPSTQQATAGYRSEPPPAYSPNNSYGCVDDRICMPPPQSNVSYQDEHPAPPPPPYNQYLMLESNSNSNLVPEINL